MNFTTNFLELAKISQNISIKLRIIYPHKFSYRNFAIRRLEYRLFFTKSTCTINDDLLPPFCRQQMAVVNVMISVKLQCNSNTASALLAAGNVRLCS